MDADALRKLRGVRRRQASELATADGRLIA
jgi:hypothetical protein